MIREMRPPDVDEILTIIRKHDPVDGQSARKYYSSYFKDDKRVKSVSENNFVVEPGLESRPVGACGFMPDEHNTPDVFWMTWFYVNEKMRGRGYGSSLLQHIIDMVSKLNARKLYIDTSSDPGYSDAISLYKKYGFEIEATLKDYYDIDEDFIVLSKTFDR